MMVMVYHKPIEIGNLDCLMVGNWSSRNVNVFSAMLDASWFNACQRCRCTLLNSWILKRNNCSVFSGLQWCSNWVQSVEEKELIRVYRIVKLDSYSFSKFIFCITDTAFCIKVPKDVMGSQYTDQYTGYRVISVVYHWLLLSSVQFHISLVPSAN